MRARSAGSRAASTSSYDLGRLAIYNPQTGTPPPGCLRRGSVAPLLSRAVRVAEGNATGRAGVPGEEKPRRGEPGLELDRLASLETGADQIVSHVQKIKRVPTKGCAAGARRGR
jgi:hypothetical protein